MEYTKAVEKEIQIEEMDHSDNVANIFLRGFDLLKEEIEEFGQKAWHQKQQTTFSFKEKWTIYLSYNQQEILDWQKN